MNMDEIEVLAKKIGNDMARLRMNNRAAFYLSSMRGMSKEEWATCVAFSDSMNTENHIQKIQEEYLDKNETQGKVFDLLDIKIENILTMDSNAIAASIDKDRKDLKIMITEELPRMNQGDLERLYNCLFSQNYKLDKTFPLSSQEVYAIGLSELKTAEKLTDFHNEMKRFAGGYYNEEFYYQIASKVLGEEKYSKSFNDNPVAMEFIKENLMQEFIRKNNGALDCGLRILTMGSSVDYGDKSRYEEMPFYRDHLTLDLMGEVLGAKYNVRHNKRRFVFPDRAKLKIELENIIFPELGKNIGKDTDITKTLIAIIKHTDMEDYMTVQEINDNITKNINSENKKEMENLFLTEKVKMKLPEGSYIKKYKLR